MRSRVVLSVRSPKLPWSFSTSTQVRQLLLFLKGVHRPKLIISVPQQLILRDQSRKRLNDQFLAIPGGYPVAAALSFTLMAAILVMVFLYVRRFGTEELV